MKKHLWTYGLAMLAGATALTLANAADAAIISITSNAGDSTEKLYGTGAGAYAAVEITPHPNWQPNLTDAKWISYANTGVGAGNQLAPFIAACSDSNAGACTPLMSVTETLDGPGMLNLTVWADDTVKVLVDGVALITPNFTQDVCADGSPGCESDESAGILNYWVAGAGPHEITFLVYQVGQNTNPSANPFGVLYSGTYEVPEPVTLSLLGAGLMGLGVAARRRRR